jgi:hypothetical protein
MENDCSSALPGSSFIELEPFMRFGKNKKYFFKIPIVQMSSSVDTFYKGVCTDT